MHNSKLTKFTIFNWYFWNKSQEKHFQILSYLRLSIIQLWKLPVNIGVSACDSAGFLWTWISFLQGCKTLRICGLFLYLPAIWLIHMCTSLTWSESWVYNHLLWGHLLSQPSAAPGFSDGTKCKAYFVISLGECSTYWNPHRSTSLRSNITYWYDWYIEIVYSFTWNQLLIRTNGMIDMQRWHILPLKINSSKEQMLFIHMIDTQRSHILFLEINSLLEQILHIDIELNSDHLVFPCGNNYLHRHGISFVL